MFTINIQVFSRKYVLIKCLYYNGVYDFRIYNFYEVLEQ